MRPRTVILAAVVLLIPVAAWAWLGRGAEGGEATITVLRDDFRVQVEATGTLEAAVYYEIGPPSVRDFWQYNLTWLIPEGTQVKKDQVIARFNATDLEDRLREHQAELETAVQEKEKEERDLDVTIREMRLDLVEAEGEITKVSVESSVPEELVPALELAQTRMKEKLARKRAAFLQEKIVFQQDLVRAKLELLEVKKSRAQLKIDYYSDAAAKFNVKSPIDGVVIYIPKPNGSRWEVGEGVWMLAKLMKVADITTLQVEAQVLEVDAARIQVEQTAEVTIDAMPGRITPSQVKEIGSIVHERSVQDSTKVFDAYLPLDAIDPAVMRPGMSVRVKVETDRVTDALSIPVKAVRMGDEGPYVLVMGEDGAEQRAVQLGLRNSDRVVVESGLDEGERVLLFGGRRG